MVFAECTSTKPNDYLSRLEVDVEDGSEFIDQWDTGELLFLASSVLRSDRNWISVSRSIKPFGEQTRPTDWYIPKNCAFQYTKLLSEIEDDSKKKTLPRTERETSEVMLVKNLTEKRLSELAWLNQQTKATANVLKSYLEMVENGDFDEHLDDLLNKMEEFDKNEEDNYNQYVSKRGNLMHAKKLNTSKIVKGKTVTKVIDPKKKLSIFPDQSDESSRQSPMKEAHIKKEFIPDEDNAKPAPSKPETITQLTLNALLDTKVTTASESPLLTSLLRSLSSPSTSQTPLSSVCSPSKEVKAEGQSHPAGPSAENSQKIDVFLSPTKLSCAGISPLLTSLLKSAALPLPTHNTNLATKESDILDDFKSDMEKSREASPRSSVPPSPRSSSASSPMLNSLLKNSPSSTTSIQLSPVKETSPKVASSPQSFISSTSALATVAQQLAVATSTLSPSHQFFQQHDLSDGRKVTIRTSPVTSVCLSAPTLSKLLEMPPSSPGRLPPLPILDPPVAPVTSIIPPTASEPTPKPPSSSQLPLDTKQPVLESPSKKTSSIAAVEPSFFPDSTVLMKSCTSYSMADRRSVSSEDVKPVLVAQKVSAKVEVLQKDSNVILEEISEVFNQAFVEVEIKKEILDEDEVSKTILDTIETTESIDILSPSCIKLEPVNPSQVEEMEISDCIVADSLAFEDVIQQKVPSTSNILPTIETASTGASSVQEPTAFKNLHFLEDDKEGSGKNVYRSRIITKKDEDFEKTVSDGSILSSPKKAISVKLEKKYLSPTIASESISTSVDIVTADTVAEKPRESKLAKSTDSRSPVSKKPRLYERSSTEKTELSEDDMPTAVRRSGRRGKKGRGRIPKSTPVRQPDKDQYEFSETEENSLGFREEKTLCYTPRSKEESSAEEAKIKSSSQDSEDAPSNASSPTEKKFSTPTRNKQGKTPQAITVLARKSLFTSDEERMSDSVTSDETSNHLLSEDKLKKWEETCEKKGDIANTANESLRRISKAIESPKKKSIAGKRSSVGKSAPGRKERKLSSLDMEDLSAGSRDSEELSSTQEKENSEEKVIVPPISLDMEVETNDSQPSSSNAAESDKQMEDNDESLQGSITTDFSPPATAEIKDDKDVSQFGKQDWFQGVSPKSSEAVSQSSEESEEYESDNWDNQSVSTNKSASQSTGMQPRLKRKERETPEYKAWKKAISIVLREASCHKNANVFLQKVTNDVAPGYLSIVHRPMDLSLIKKNIDNGIVRTTEEFHRDMQIMFQNAIMYNSSDHDVHQMAVEMQQDVLDQISAFMLTQSNCKDEVSEPVSSLRGTRKSQKGKLTASSTKGKEDVDKE